MPVSVVVAGALANKPCNGGEAWVRLSWALGLRRLGVDVLFVEEISAEACQDAEGRAAPIERSVNRHWFERVADEFGLDDATLVLADGSATVGLPLDEVAERSANAALLVNISGNLRLERIRRRFRRAAFVDIDPGFTQYWHAMGDTAGLAGHDAYFTVGENVATTGSSIPTGGIHWRPVRQPVVLREWPVTTAQGGFRGFSTVASWRGAFGPMSWEGRRYGIKAHEFRRVIDLPRRAPQRFEIALDIHAADAPDRLALAEHGWSLVDPREAAGTPDAFRRYVRDSGAEFSPAQGMYVDTCSGWFSDRTTRYLASGKPALVQETGFSRHIPTGEGLVSYRTLDQAVTGAERIARDYEAHAQAARELAERFFDSEVVLARFLDEAGVDS